MRRKQPASMTSPQEAPRFELPKQRASMPKQRASTGSAALRTAKTMVTLKLSELEDVDGDEEVDSWRDTVRKQLADGLSETPAQLAEGDTVAVWLRSNADAAWPGKAGFLTVYELDGETGEFFLTSEDGELLSCRSLGIAAGRMKLETVDGWKGLQEVWGKHVDWPSSVEALPSGGGAITPCVPHGFTAGMRVKCVFKTQEEDGAAESSTWFGGLIESCDETTCILLASMMVS